MKTEACPAVKVALVATKVLFDKLPNLIQGFDETLKAPFNCAAAISASAPRTSTASYFPVIVATAPVIPF